MLFIIFSFLFSSSSSVSHWPPSHLESRAPFSPTSAPPVNPIWIQSQNASSSFLVISQPSVGFCRSPTRSSSCFSAPSSLSERANCRTTSTKAGSSFSVCSQRSLWTRCTCLATGYRNSICTRTSPLLSSSSSTPLSSLAVCSCRAFFLCGKTEQMRLNNILSSTPVLDD